MKRFLAILLLLTLLPLIPAMGEDEIDVPAVIQEDTWLDDNFTMTFAADGTGVMTYRDITHEGTWEYVNGMVYFHYDQLGEQTIKLSVTKKDGQYSLSGNYFTLQTKSSREQNEQEAAKTAKKKTHALEWGEEITLDFITFTLDDVKVYRSQQQAIDDFPSNYLLSTVKGKKFLLVTGTVKNLDDNVRLLNNIRAEVILDKESSYKTEVFYAKKGDTYFNSALNANVTGKLVFSTELPEDTADSFATAQLRFSLNNYLAGAPKKDFEGDFFFSLNIGKAKVKEARKVPSRKKTYLEYGKNKSVPSATFCMDVRVSVDGTWSDMHPTDGKIYEIKCYSVSSRFDGDKPEDFVKTYVKALKKEGFTVTKVNGEKSKYNNETLTFYTISSEKTPLGWITVSSSNTYSMSVYIVKK